MYLFLCTICISYLSVPNLINSVPVNVYNVHVYAKHDGGSYVTISRVYELNVRINIFV